LARLSGPDRFAAHISEVVKRQIDSSMKCYAAALALLGWFLFLPPAYSDHRPDTNAPLSLWLKANRKFPSLSECQRAKQGLINLHVPPYSSEHEREKAEGEKAAICVSSDDPRLKGY
jgi:hypothetical protein